MEFIEAPTFTKAVIAWLDDDDYAALQAILALRPDAGRLIPGGSGLRKLRWAAEGRGKRGGLRVIYYWLAADQQIWMLLAYPKNEQDNLSPQQMKQLKTLVEDLKR